MIARPPVQQAFTAQQLELQDKTKAMAPVTLVAGFGRCGSSLTMQMLDAAGLTMLGCWPAFEVKTIVTDEDSRWLAHQGGKVFKLLVSHPNHFTLNSDVAWRTIWIDRRGRDLATSQIKLLRAGGATIKREAFDALRQSYRRDRAKTLRKLRKAGPVLCLRFEHLVTCPKHQAARIAAFLDLDHSTIEMMSRRVIERKPDVRPNMSLEQLLILQGRDAAEKLRNGQT